MRIWTIQHIDVWRKIQKKGRYTCDRRFICFTDFKEPYAWLVEEAKRRNPQWKQDRPVWFWTKRPDLRQHRHISTDSRPYKEKFVLMELEVDPKDLLISDFDLWHLVLNRSYVPTSSKDWDRFYNQMPKKYQFSGLLDLPRKYRDAIVKSWSRIVVGPKHKALSQAIKEDIKKEEVVSVKEFVMTNLRKKPRA